MEEKNWVNEYSRELDRTKRQQILAAAIEEEGLSPANELRKKLIDARYGKNKSQEIDYFVRGIMRLFYLKNGAGRFFAKGQSRREKEGIRSDLKLASGKPYGEVGEQVLYEEYSNLARLYISLCKSDKNYGAILLGLGKMKESSLVNKIARDIYTAAFDVPERAGMTDEMRTFQRAFTDVFCETFPDKQALLTERIGQK